MGENGVRALGIHGDKGKDETGDLIVELLKRRLYPKFSIDDLTGLVCVKLTNSKGEITSALGICPIFALEIASAQFAEMNPYYDMKAVQEQKAKLNIAQDQIIAFGLRLWIDQIGAPQGLGEIDRPWEYMGGHWKDNSVLPWKWIAEQCSLAFGRDQFVIAVRNQGKAYGVSMGWHGQTMVIYDTTMRDAKKSQEES